MKPPGYFTLISRTEKKGRIFCLAAGLALTASLALAQEDDDVPGLENVLIESSGPLNPVAGDENEIPDAEPPVIEPAAPPNSSNVPRSLNAEIVMLAKSLGDGAAAAGENPTAKAIRIFNWVRNTIDYDHYYGLRKGSSLTLLEGSGNDFDQSLLLRDLLVAAGYPESHVKLRMRTQRVAYDKLVAWMGLASEPFPGKTYSQATGNTIAHDFSPHDQGVSNLVAKQVNFGLNFLNWMGSTMQNEGHASYDYSTLPGTATFVLNRVWVQLTVSGVNYQLDPSYKTYENLGSADNLLSEIGYSASHLSTIAQGSGNADSVSGLNQANVENYLKTLTVSLRNVLKSNAYAGLPIEALVNGRRIVKHDIVNLNEAFSLPFNFFGAFNKVFDSAEDPRLDSYQTKLLIKAGDINYEQPTCELEGRKISLTFSGNTAELRLDDGAPVAATSVGGSSIALTMQITHPGLPGTKKITQTYRKGNGFAYVLLYGFKASGRLIQMRHRVLQSYLNAGKADNSREVRTELLNIMGLTWLYQTELSYRLLAAENGVIAVNHHRFGRMGQEEGFYVDVGLAFSSIMPNNGFGAGGSFAPRVDNAFHLGGLFASAMEHGIIEQMQPHSAAVSTVNILRRANASPGNALVLGRPSNWNTVRGVLLNNGYSPARLESFDAQIEEGGQFFLPRKPDVVQGIWKGSGWIIRKDTRSGSIISGEYGNYSGGYSTDAGQVSSPFVTAGNFYNPSTNYTNPTPRSIPISSASPRYYGSDPVDMASGAFLYASDDLIVGTEGAPRGGAFSRAYSSGSAQQDEQGLGYGWTHNLYIRASRRSAGEIALGEGTPQEAAPFLLSMLVAEGFNADDATPKQWGIATLVAGWFVDQIKDNAVSVRIGKDVFQFAAQPNGSFLPPPGTTLSLTTDPDGSYRFQQRLGNTIEFNLAGKATRIVDVDGRQMSFFYKTDGELDYVQDAAGRRLTFDYAGEHITSVTDSTSPTRTVQFRYDAEGNLNRTIDPELKNTWFDYEVAGDPGGTTSGEHLIVRLRNHDLQTVTQNIYDSLNRVKRQYLHGNTTKTFNLFYTGGDNYEIDPQGGATHYFYDSRGRSSGKRDAAGNETITKYDAQDRVTEVISGSRESTKYFYDGANNLRRVDRPRGGGSVVMDYDSLNRLDLRTDPDGSITDYVYFPSGVHAGKDRPQSIISGKGSAAQSTTTYQYLDSGTAKGRVWKITDGDGLGTEYSYDQAGQPYQTTAPGGFVTTTGYDARGNLALVKDALAAPIQKKIVYNLRRQVTSITSDFGGSAPATEDRIYDNVGRLQSKTDPADNDGQHVERTFTYTPTDKIDLEKLAGVTVADHGYDQRDWEDTVSDAAARQTSIFHWANGDVREIRRPGARSRFFDYDGDGRVTSATEPGANSGRRQSSFGFDATSDNFPRTVETLPDGRMEISVFDPTGRLRFLTDRKGKTFEFRYDGQGRRSDVIAPGMAARQTTYTGAGKVSTVTEPSGDKITFGYDGMTGRVSTAAYKLAGGGTSTVNFTSYDNNGRLLALDENGTDGISRTYDHLGRINSRTARGATVGYRYYPSGRLAKIIYPGGSELGVGHVEYTYWPDGRLKDVNDRLDSTSSPRVTHYYWRTDGRLDHVTRPNGTIRSITYDPAGRPDGILERAGSTTVLQHAIGYYPSDDIRTLEVTPPVPKLAAVPPAEMSHDDANRLATYNGIDAGTDSDGNLTFGPLPQTGAMANFGYDSRNRLISAGGLTYTYDAEDNRVAIGGSEAQSFVIDAGGGLPRVIGRTKNGVTTRYVYGAGLQYEVSAGGQATYYHYDQSGNTAMLTSQGGAVVERIAYAPYGTVRYRQTGFDTPFLFGGFFGVMSDANGLIQMRARYYNPLTARFMTSDPAMEGWNWYAYAGGNPVNFADPSGFGGAAVVDALQGGLTVLGFAPVVGAVADIVNAGISAARGDAAGAAFNLASAVPGIGDAAAAGKIAVVGIGAAKFARTEFAAAEGITTLDASAIRFSQSNVRSSLPQVTQSMKANGWQGAPIDVVRMTDGSLTAVDNTRLAAASLSNTPVQATIRGFDEVFPAARAGGNLQGGTWGEAILNRIENQKPAWQRLYPSGSPYTGVNSSTPGF